ncbi:MAG: SPOR domain-containing protein [Tannerella sp.]|jgi:cell division septation protein DedD|nr:SPOR domain-containing protein [Tannerella sp.]
MDRIIEHIERLLLWHDCVIIPDFGGFVLQSVSAVYMGNEHSFTPARKEIVFNPTLTHNDGLLTESYMQKHAADFKEAFRLLREDVSVVKEALDDDLEFQFGRIGLFIKEDNRILFVPDKNSDLLFSTLSYGLPVFHYLSLASRKLTADFTHEPSSAVNGAVADTQKTENPPDSKNIIYTIPISRTFIRFLGAMAATVVLFLLISTPVKDVNKTSYSAGFVPQEIMPKKTADEIVSNAFSASDALEYAGHPVVSDGYVVEPESPEATVSFMDAKTNDFPNVGGDGADVKSTAETKREVASEAITKSPEATPGAATKSPETTSETAAKSPETASKMTAKSPEAASGAATKSPETASKTAAKSPAASSAGKASSASTAKTASKVVSGKYYVIIASFDTYKRAQNYVKNLKGDVARDAGIIVNDGKVRVYAQQFSTERSAQSYMNKIRQSSEHGQAWLYKGR